MKHEIELTIFSLFLVLWLYFVAFKRILILNGADLLSQNVPSLIRDYVFGQFSIVEALVLIGLIPVIAGIYVTYKHLFTEKHKNYHLIISLIVVSAITVWIGLMPLMTTLIVIGFGFAILFADYYERFISYISKSKFSAMVPFFVVLLVLLVLVTSFIPAYYVAAVRNYDLVPEHDVSALLWLRYQTSDDTVIAVSPMEGALVLYSTGKQVIADMDFVGVEDVEKYNEDLRMLFRTPWKTDALMITEEYGITHIMLTDTTRAFYGIEDLAYADMKCFKLSYNGYERVKIYKVSCRMGAVP